MGGGGGLGGTCSAFTLLYRKPAKQSTTAMYFRPFSHLSHTRVPSRCWRGYYTQMLRREARAALVAVQPVHEVSAEAGGYTAQAYGLVMCNETPDQDYVLV